jgi:hypothetical protein
VILLLLANQLQYVVDDLVAFVAKLASPEHSQYSLDDVR